MCVCLPCHKKQQVAFQRGALKMPENEEAFSGERCGMTCTVELSARWPRLQAAVEAGGSVRVHGLFPCGSLRPGTAWAAGQRLELCIKTRTTCRCAVSLASFFLVFPVLLPFCSAPFLWLLLPSSLCVRQIALDLQWRRGGEGMRENGRSGAGRQQQHASPARPAAFSSGHSIPKHACGGL